MTMMSGEMSPSLKILCLSVFGIMSLVALLGNGFITAANGYSLLQSRKVIPCGLLLICLSISRFLMQGILMTNQYLYLSSPRSYEFSCTEQFLNIAWNCCNMASFSSDTTLHVFYCLKVTTFAFPPFLWLKSRIHRLIPVLLAIPCIAFVVFSLPSFNVYLNQGECYILTGNVTERRNPKTEEVFQMFVPVRFTLPALCFLICLAACILLLVSLWRHMRNLKRNGLNVKDLSTQAHLIVMKSLLCFLFFFVVYFITMNVAFFKDFKINSPEHLISIILLSLYPSVHSIVLIVTNPKLREMCVRILDAGKRFPCYSSSSSAK